MQSGWRRSCGTVVLLVSLAMAGCATRGPNPQDPWESYNRSTMEFNDALDRAVLKPVAIAYRDLTPSPLRTGVNNFFGNLKDVWSMVNAALQLKPQATVEQGMRIGLNTVFGFYGVLDIATELDMPRHHEDFGQTLGRWGVKTGPYVVLPVFGPSTLRDALATFTVDSGGDLVQHIHHVPARNGAYVARLVDTRMQLLRTEELINDAALDRYSFIRDGYLQLRKNQSYDGDVPE